MERIPFDIIINHIIPYTYNIQPTTLLQDIKNYYTIKTELINEEYDTKIIKNELLANCYMNKCRFDNILARRFQIAKCIKKHDKHIFEKYSLDRKFNIVFGLLTRDERTYFSEYIRTELQLWL